MSGAGRAVAVVVLFSAGLSLASCVSVNRAALKQGKSDTARYLAAGEYQKAIDLQKAMHRQDPGNKKITAEYIATVEEIKKAADAARSKTDYGAAAGTYGILIDNWDGDKVVAGELPFARSDLEAALRICRNALRGQEARRELKAGHYEKALGLYRATLKDQLQEKSARTEYASAVLEIMAAGDKALAGHDYAAAGKIDSLLLKNVESFQGLEEIGKANSASLKESLVETIKVRGQNLANSGLVEYRKGNLEKAIEIWNDLLAFDPGNVEIKKAVETARAQLGKLKKIG